MRLSCKEQSLQPAVAGAWAAPTWLGCHPSAQLVPHRRSDPLRRLASLRWPPPPPHHQCADCGQPASCVSNRLPPAGCIHPLQRAATTCRSWTTWCGGRMTCSWGWTLSLPLPRLTTACASELRGPACRARCLWRVALHILRRPALLAGVRGAGPEPLALTSQAGHAQGKAHRQAAAAPPAAAEPDRPCNAFQMRCRWGEVSGKHIDLQVGDICDWEFLSQARLVCTVLWDSAAIGCYPIEKTAPEPSATGRSSARCAWLVRFWATSVSFKFVRFCATSLPATICAGTSCDWEVFSQARRFCVVQYFSTAVCLLATHTCTPLHTLLAQIAAILLQQLPLHAV